MIKSFVAPDLQRYIEDHTLHEPALLARLRQETASHPQARMQISAEEGQFLQLLIRATGARRTLEIGVFTGYSSLAVALALPEDGRIVACDISDEFTRTARRYWDEAGIAHKIDLKLAPALATLDALLAAGRQNSFDFAFIDADKPSYPAYYERCLELLRPGGLLAIDNTLQEGKVSDPANHDPNTLVLRDFNQQLHHDPRVHLSLLPLADGLTLAVKLPAKNVD